MNLLLEFTRDELPTRHQIFVDASCFRDGENANARVKSEVVIRFRAKSTHSGWSRP